MEEKAIYEELEKAGWAVLEVRVASYYLFAKGEERIVYSLGEDKVIVRYKINMITYEITEVRHG